MDHSRKSNKKVLPKSINPLPLPPPQEENGIADDSSNPMTNSVILRELFKVIPFDIKEFKNFRLVSKLWLESSLSRWRQEVWLHVRDGKFTDQSQSTFLFYEPYLELLSLPGDPLKLVGNHVFRKLKLSTAQGTSGDFWKQDALLLFWSKIGSSLTHLKVLRTTLDSAEVITRVIFEMTPKLKFLSLERVTFVGGVQNLITQYGIKELSDPVWNEKLKPLPSEVQRNLNHFEIEIARSEHFELSWINFFLRFPNIKSFKLDNVPYPSYSNDRTTVDHDELLRIFQSIKVAREHGDPDVLSNLNQLELINSQEFWLDVFRPKIMNLLGQLSFPMTSLSFEVDSMQRVDDFRAMLDLFSSTLKRLLVYRTRTSFYAEPFFECFPFGVDLPHLEELKLIGPIIVNLDFLEHTPSLKTLVLLDGPSRTEVAEGLNSYQDFSLRQRQTLPEGNEREWILGTGTNDVISSTNFASEPMKSLVLSQMEEFIVGDELCDGKQIEVLSKLMPGLKKARIGLGNEGFQVVCKKWTELRHLDIQPFDVEEEGMLGREGGRKYAHANVTDLKYLVSLRMGSHSQDQHKGGLTNSSIVDGLLVAESLKNVSFSQEPTACKKVQTMLTEKFPQCNHQLKYNLGAIHMLD